MMSFIKHNAHDLETLNCKIEERDYMLDSVTKIYLNKKEKNICFYEHKSRMGNIEHMLLPHTY